MKDEDTQCDENDQMSDVAQVGCGGDGGRLRKGKYKNRCDMLSHEMSFLMPNELRRITRLKRIFIGK